MTDFYMKQHDTAPAIQFAFTDLSGVVPPGSLSGATVKFFMKLPGAMTCKVNSAATIVNPASFLFGYAWVTGDTDTAGEYNGEFEVTYADGTKQSFPDPGYLDILITADLDGT